MWTASAMEALDVVDECLLFEPLSDRYGSLGDGRAAPAIGTKRTWRATSNLRGLPSLWQRGMGSVASTGRYRFGSFELQFDERRLLKDGAVVPLRPRAFAILGRRPRSQADSSA